MNDRKITLEIRSIQENVSLAAAAASAIAGLASLTETDRAQIDLCATEALTNCIRHGYGSEAEHPIRMTLCLCQDHIRIDVCHRGGSAQALQQALDKIAFATEDEFEAFMMQSLMNEGGRGLALIKHYMNEVAVSVEAGWVCLTMIKRLVGQ
ncbi:MAG: ATP-binding protein [Gammaproteobacteria bacterium]|nr:ATP-binding protein [Gammaproteobacteria bacterium]MBU1654486.1 ATP-binding protein [Gammaproteobacteria bacterium]MBU1960138.1 ATP-binding protein [Gammaproteobacteria bacterium]